MNTEFDKSIMIIFGATGDLTHRKLVPALYYLEKEKKLPKNFEIIAVGRRDKTTEIFREEMSSKIKANITDKPQEDVIESILGRISYHRQDLSDAEGYKKLKAKTDAIGKERNILFYLAVAPQFFSIIAENLSECGLSHSENAWRRIVIEKPFGRDLVSAEDLNKTITGVFPEKNIYRIDHYLGKEMLQNLITIRFANAVFEPVWNRKYIDNVQISSSEKLGVETRGGYYENSGILRDMVQNHMLQLLTLTAMEPPETFSEEHVRNSKLEVLKSIVKSFDSVETVCGQYGQGKIDGKKVIAYRDEENVDTNSKTATYAALKVMIDNDRWKGVPFYIRTGKRMKEKSTEVVLQFKNDMKFLGQNDANDVKPNLLIIKNIPRRGCGV